MDRDLGGDVVEWMRTAGSDGGFLLIVGDSCVGKTRLIFEAARAVLGDFHVLAPTRGDGDVINKLASAPGRLPSDGLVVWLDELQRYLQGPYFVPDPDGDFRPVTAKAIERLLNAETAVVFVATMRPEHRDRLQASDHDPASGVDRPIHQLAVDVLDLVDADYALQTFSSAERTAARDVATYDPRVAVALADRDYNVTEALAGVRELMSRYRQGTSEQRALIHAIIDMRRVGIESSVPATLLREAARGYLTRATGDGSWFRRALDSVTSRDRRADRATAPVLEVLDRDRRTIVGYTVSDYLTQQLSRARRSECLPAVTWRALMDNTWDSAPLLRLAGSAERRLLYDFASTLYERHITTFGPAQPATWRYPDLVLRKGATMEALDKLRQLADKDDGIQQRLIELLPPDSAEMWTWADVDSRAAHRLADVLISQGRPQDAADILYPFVPAHGSLKFSYITALKQLNDTEELQRLAADGDYSAAHALAELYVASASPDEIRHRAETGDPDIRRIYLDHLAAQHDLVALRNYAAAGDMWAASHYATLLAADGSIDEAVESLRPFAGADRGNWRVTRQLVDLLNANGEHDAAIATLRAFADDWRIAWDLGDALIADGRVHEAIAVFTPHAIPMNGHMREHLAQVLADHNMIEELRKRAAHPIDTIARTILARTLFAAGDIEGLREHVEQRPLGGFGTFDEYGVGIDANDMLAELVAGGPDIDEALSALRRAADDGDIGAARQLIKLLIRNSLVDQLWQEVFAGTFAAGAALIGYLDRHDQAATAEILRRCGLSADGSVPACPDLAITT
ncbi:hypothetical protein [Longispora fulva]|uniref:Thioredoxin-like negative regulator of GroEL n=1 Tax=Longispora fulva TaxID=619741 RepID=A0A8J7GCK3_9ACTN|nr:hypothetical protein [Longispora fulva]MBG6136119.1 thioredoxin-like negative regulator of GroEL [Longispora fulva]